MIAARPLWLPFFLLALGSAPTTQETVQSGYVDVDGGRLYYEQAGSGMPVVLIHGGFLDHRMWDGQFDVVAEQYRAIRYDVRAHGRSHSDSVPFADQDDLRQLLDALAVPRAVIVGLSMGGRIAVDFALTDPDRVAGLVLVGAGLSGFEPQSEEIASYIEDIREAAQVGFPEVFETFAHWWCDGPYRERPDVDPVVRGRVREMLEGSKQRWMYSPLERQLEPPAIGRLEEIHVPTLAVVGTLDMPDIDQLAHMIDQQVPGAERVYIQDVAHMVNMEKPEEFNGVLLEFLAGVVGELHGMSSGTQAIFDAARDGNTARVRELLETDPQVVHAIDENNSTPLHHAASRGHVDVATVLLDRGADIDACDEDGETPLHYAAWRSQLETGRLLISRGADLEARNNWGRTPLLIVGRETGGANMASLLIDAGAEVNARDRYGASSLDLAAWRGFADLVDLLLDEGAELPPPSSNDGRMLAMFSADKGLDRLFNLIVDAGVDLSLRNERDGSLLHSASQGGSAEIVARLLDQGFDPNERDRYGRTPLHYAAELGREQAARMLLAHGAKIDARSLSGETACNTAQWVERANMVRMLSDAGADTEPRRFPELSGPYMGQEPPAPGGEPMLFAPDIVSTHRFQHGTIAFSPSGDEAFWSSQIAIQETGYSQGVMLFSRLENGMWTEPVPASFSQLGSGDDVPTFSPDGARLYFLSARKEPSEEEGRGERIWYVDRTATGWSDPQIVPGGPNTVDLHWSFSVAADGSLYIASRGELFVSRYVDGRYAEPENLGAAVNSDANESMPFIAPDGSYLLFTRFEHPDNHGFADLWISLPDEQGAWTEPVNLGEQISSMGGICPTVSADGRYLFFNTGSDDNYWVDASFIEELRAG